MRFGMVNVQNKGPIRANMFFLWQNPKVFIGLLFSISISGESIKMIMLISLECNLAQTRMGFGMVTLSSKGPNRGQYVFIMAIPQRFLKVLYLQFMFLETQILFA